jgi:DNA-binding response OmpR family regulator
VETFRALLVDDDLDAAHDQAALLRVRLGAAIVVPDAYQALERLREERFDVVIAEVALPGASGIDSAVAPRAAEFVTV